MSLNNAQARWSGAGLRLPVSINLSARSLTKPDLAAWILAELARRSLDTGLLCVEVTETAAAADFAQAVRLLGPLHDEGVRISIDDFGAGYTSLSILPALPLDELKVDKRFVIAAPTSVADDAIVRTVRELTRRLGLTVVAEGVESEAIDQLVTEIGYDILQGYHFSWPLTEADLLTQVAAKALPQRGRAIR